jgi:hypothetical protein
MTFHPAVFAVCLIAASWAAIVFVLKRARYRRWYRAVGTVIELIRQESRDSDGRMDVTFSPRVSFQTVTGDTWEFVSSVSSFPAPAVGETVEVLYDPDDPREATIDQFMFRHLGEFVVFCLGALGVLIYVYQRFAA